jgi:hypothetical protein
VIVEDCLAQTGCTHKERLRFARKGILMTHRDRGHFAAKHPAGTKVDARLADAVRQRASAGLMTCEEAFEIAAALGVTPGQVGMAIDMQEGRIHKCQLGLFGYTPRKKVVQAAASVPPELRSAIVAALARGRLPCAAAWRIADTAGLSRLAVANACETLEIKIAACQLGAF